MALARVAARRGRRAQGDRVHRLRAEDAQREDHAPPAQGARARPARGRHLDARGRRGMKAATAPKKKPAVDREHALHLLREMLLHPPVRGEGGGGVQPRQDPRLPPPLHRRGGLRGRRDAGARPRGRRRRHLPRSRPRARTRPADERADGGDVRQVDRLQPRARRLDALLRRLAPLLRRQRRSSRPGSRSRSGSRSPTPTRGGSGSPPASSATAPSSRASSTSA